MRIAIVTDTFAPDINGVAMTLQQLAHGLLQRGHAVLLVSPVKNAGDPLAGHPNFWRYRTDRIPLPGYPGLRLGVPTKRRLGKLWKDNRPDIIYIATETAIGLTSLRVARKRDIPIVSGFHTNFHSYSKDYRLPFLEDVAVSYLRRIHNETDATFAPTEEISGELRKLGFKNVHILGRGIDTGLFHPGRRSAELRSTWGADDKMPVALYVGRLAAEKNLDLFFRACEHAQKTAPELKVVLVGDGPSRKEFQEKHPHAHFAGIQTGEDLAAHYASADLFLFPSTSETYGNVVVEALASGLVTLAYEYAAPAKFIRDGHNGYLAPLDDEDAFLGSATTAARAAFDPGLRQAAAASVQAESWESVVAGFEKNLQDIVANYTPRGPLTLDLKLPSKQDSK